MNTSKYVLKGKVVTEHLGPINAVILTSTGLILPVLDLTRQVFPLINGFACVAVVAFIGVLLFKSRSLPWRKAVSHGLVLTLGICATVFCIGALASSKHKSDGGVIASTFPQLRELQARLLHTERQNDKIIGQLEWLLSGKSENPRVQLRNSGVEWSEASFEAAIRRGDLESTALFFQGGMPWKRSADKKIPLPEIALRANAPNITELFQIFEHFGIDLNGPDAWQPVPPSNFTEPRSLYAYAMGKNNIQAADYLLAKGADDSVYRKWIAERDQKIAERNHKVNKSGGILSNQAW